MAVNAAPAYTGMNVIVGQANCYTAPFSATTPPALPLDTVALNTAWSSPWTPVGATEEGLSFKFSRKTQDIMVEEQANAVFVATKELTFEFDLSLSEDSFEVMKLAFGGGTIADTAGTMSVNGYRVMTIANDLQNLAFGFEALNNFGGPRRVMIPNVVSVADVEVKYRRADDARRYNVSFRSLSTVGACTFRDVKPIGVS